MKKRYLMFGLVVAAAGLAHAADNNKVYKWKDANGVTHFSDAPPPKGQQFDNVKIVGQSAPITTNDAAKPVDPAASPTAAASAEPGSDAERKSQRCAQARQREQLLAGQSQLTIKRDGKDVLLDGNERASELAIARTQVEQYCGGAGG